MAPEKMSAYMGVLARMVYQDGNLLWANAWKKQLNGTVAGREDSDGYRRIHIPSIGMIGVHRLIFLLHHGFLPEFVDHIDGNPRNNRIENLRAATRHENAWNVKTPRANTSGRKGVYHLKPSGKWQVSIRVNCKLKYIGVFNTFEEACIARDQAEQEFHGEYRRSSESVGDKNEQRI
ncbi:HNH endonuclease [Burkholderia multivorans]|uniref:HNH endonuclease n=1 Tax=Burkholderia multivorans TaxID=87883 RepID=UPI001C27C9BE|nr:HNH endonuclease [Burkholderia multivorans]MBU9563063.1 HNH endonuclease [Burkholderia multivorans]MCA8251535.1 HNH endonuclease [Burkholderia multivorans]